MSWSEVVWECEEQEPAAWIVLAFGARDVSSLEILTQWQLTSTQAGPNATSRYDTHRVALFPPNFLVINRGPSFLISCVSAPHTSLIIS